MSSQKKELQQKQQTWNSWNTEVLKWPVYIVARVNLSETTYYSEPTWLHSNCFLSQKADIYHWLRRLHCFIHILQDAWISIESFNKSKTNHDNRRNRAHLRLVILVVRSPEKNQFITLFDFSFPFQETNTDDRVISTTLNLFCTTNVRCVKSKVLGHPAA
jgi:hypothetical protein